MRQAPDHGAQKTVTGPDNAGGPDRQTIRTQGAITSYEQRTSRPQRERDELHKTLFYEAPTCFD